MSLAESLERAATQLSQDADAIRPANGDPSQLLGALDAAAASRVLAWMFANEPDAAEEMASDWLEAPSGLAAIEGVGAGDLPKPGRKALRRVLHRARSRGLTVAPAASAPAEKVARLPKIDERLDSAFVCPFDARGSRLVYLIRSHPSGGARVFEAVLDPDNGIPDFRVYRTGRSQVRDFLRRLTRRHEFSAVGAEQDAVRALVARCAERQPADRPFPAAFKEWRKRLFEGAEGGETPAEEVARALEGQSASAEELSELGEHVRARGVGPWPPPTDRLTEVVEPVRDRVSAGEAPEPAAVEKELADSLAELYVGELAAAAAVRFEETAYMAWKEGLEGRARACLATGEALRAGQGPQQPVVASLCALLASELVPSLGLGATSDPTGETGEVG